jgi:DNA-binding NtrC family response regulator
MAVPATLWDHWCLVQGAVLLAMVDENQFPEMPGAAVLIVEPASNSIQYCNVTATTLLEREMSDLVGKPWWKALGVARESDQALPRAIGSGIRTAIPPTLLSPALSVEIVVGGYLFPQESQGEKVLVLLLFRLGVGQDFLSARPVGPSDVVAVLGLENTGGENQWEPGNIARRMVDIRFGLQQIVPTKEDVGMPVGATIPIALRNVTIEQSQDISRALLSHLTPLLERQARIRIGMAQCEQEESPLVALIAANNALLRMQRTTVGDLIATADGQDNQLLGASAALAEGIFSEGYSPPASRAYLSKLVALVIDPQHANEYLWQVLDVTLRQSGVAAAAVYRRRFDDSYEYVVGGLAIGDGTEFVPGLEKQLPRQMRQATQKLTTDQLQSLDRIVSGKSPCAIFPIRLYERVLGYMAIQHETSGTVASERFAPDVSALHHFATEISTAIDWRQAGERLAQSHAVAPRPIDERIDGYVGDNMEGAIDQAVFLSRLDVPVAIIGPRGTGKLYVAKVIHQESGAAPEKMVAVDCREFRGRKDALNRIARELERSKGKTLVFKSPHLMNVDAQLKLARQISTRILADTNPPRYLPAARIIGLFPDNLEHLVRRGELSDKLASVFSAYPIRVPPIKDRKRAVLRWAHKILSQEGARRDRKLTGFTPDAEQAMLQHDWPGNISEMRQCIVSALDKSDKEWLTPVDLGIFKGLSPGGGGLPEKRAYLQMLVEAPPEEAEYAPTTLEELGVALGEALHSLMEMEAIKPLGAWLDDEVILAVNERYRENMRAAADFLQTKPRNLGRWMPKVLSRENERNSSSLWQTPQQLVRRWLKEAAPMPQPPQQLVQGILLSHVVSQCGSISVADRARIMGVSTPTYQKRLQEVLDQ